MVLRSTLLATLVVGGLGCAKAGAVYRDDTASYPAADMDMEAPAPTDEADAGRTASITEVEAEESRPRLFERRAARKAQKAARAEVASPTAGSAAQSPEPTPPPAGAAGGEAAPQAEPAVERPEPDAHGRHIIYTATLHVSVFNLDEAMTEVEALPESYGGYIHSMSQGHVVMRVPSKKLRAAMDELAALGVVEQRSLQAQDVTAEYVDVESRIRVLEETQKQLIGLLAKARTVEEALEVRKALDQITMELEVLKGRMRQLQNQITFSTITLTMTERGPHVATPSSNDPFPWVNDLGVEATEWK